MSFSTPAIFFSILPTQNGDYADLRWNAQIDPKIHKSVQVGEPLCCYAFSDSIYLLGSETDEQNNINKTQ